jgi:hypothetical protein
MLKKEFKMSKAQQEQIEGLILKYGYKVSSLLFLAPALYQIWIASKIFGDPEIIFNDSLAGGELVFSFFVLIASLLAALLIFNIKSE